jgi:hypothetical protein
MTTKQDNLSIRIFDKLYLGVQSRKGSVAHGYMIPYEDNAAGRKRMANVDHWGREKSRVILENKPISGFKVSRAQRHAGWKNVITSIMMEDPRGFEIEITMTNLVMLTDNALIQNGEILQECVWARDGSFNVLLPVNSEPYKEAKENTRRVTTKVSTRTLNIGDKVQTDKALVGIYMGYLHPVIFSTSLSSSSNSWQPRVVEKKVHVLKITSDNGETFFQGISSFKVSDILEPTTEKMTLRDVELLISTSTDKCRLQGMRNYRERVLAFIASEEVTTKVAEIALDYDDLKNDINGKNIWSETHHQILYRSPAPIKTNHLDPAPLANQAHHVSLANFSYSINGTSRYIHNRGYVTSKDLSMTPIEDSLLSQGIVREIPTAHRYGVCVDSSDTDHFFKLEFELTTKNGVIIKKDL